MDSAALADLEILIVSPLAGPSGSEPFLGARFRTRESARTPKEVEVVLDSQRRRFDVVLVDLMWNDFDLEWSYDGLDVITAIQGSGRSEPVLLACQGHGFERPYLEEARDLPDVQGMVLKSRPDRVLEAIQRVGTGRGPNARYDDPALSDALHAPERSIAHYFHRHRRVARIAGVIASGCAGDYAEIAGVLGVTVEAVNVSPALFRELLESRGELSPDEQLSQARIFRWCGENAHFITSWCRRHAHDLGKPARIFTRRR